ncbi:MAG: tripartite tricarboxylate transporter TctB family protein [Burkholderiales bacterium]|nr:tripartite tricarboxylate transporter TctB family protein [Burkholderiales bacterium]
MPKGQLFLSIGVIVIGALVLGGAFQIPDAGGYSTVGPGAVPKVVGAALLLLGAFLVYEVLWLKGFRNHDEEAERALPMNWTAFAWISGGLIVYGLTIEHLGFVPSSVLLFMATAAGFNSKRWLSNAVIALVLASAIFAMFNYGLGLNLPKGFLKGVIP